MNGNKIDQPYAVKDSSTCRHVISVMFRMMVYISIERKATLPFQFFFFFPPINLKSDSRMFEVYVLMEF